MFEKLSPRRRMSAVFDGRHGALPARTSWIVTVSGW
jgi:hypothetical protein